jgi:hypothetical protein
VGKINLLESVKEVKMSRRNLFQDENICGLCMLAVLKSRQSLKSIEKAGMASDF